MLHNENYPSLWSCFHFAIWAEEWKVLMEFYDDLHLGFWTKRDGHRTEIGHMEQYGEKHRVQSNTGKLSFQICRWAS